MTIQTNDGIDIYCLPQNAICRVTGENPLRMSMCPICSNDDFGNLCIPEECMHYVEGKENS